jgi:hypothetical protein
MIQLDEKLPEPPAYTNVGSPQQVQQTPASSGYQYASPPVQSPMSYPPNAANGLVVLHPPPQQQPQQQLQLTPAQMEAQVGHQYQQQCTS